MMKKIFFTFFFTMMCFSFVCVSESFAEDMKATSYTVKYSKTERAEHCRRLRDETPKVPEGIHSLSSDIIPGSVLESIVETTKMISNNVALISVLGDTLMCHATHGGKKDLEIWSVRIFTFPDIPVWLCGAIIYFIGFMLVLSVCFYVIDISFKLGFAIILMPIGIALWPFEKTKDKLSILISIFLKSAAIFPFLAITVAFTLNMVSVSLEDLKDVFSAITNNNTDLISKKFSLTATSFLLVLTSLVYGMKLIGKSVSEYANNFFPDKAFGGASPIHDMATQALDFAKQKVVQPVASLAHDIVKTQAGKVTEKAGNLLQGKYHQDIVRGVKNIGIAFRNPKQSFKKAQLSVAKTEAKAIGGVMKGYNHLKYGVHMAALGVAVAGKQNRADLKEQLRNERDGKNQRITETINNNYEEAVAPLNEAITQNEKTRQNQKDLEAKQKEDAKQARMATDPKYKARVERRQNVQKVIHNTGNAIRNIDQSRKASISTMEDKIDDLNDKRDKALIKTEKIYQNLDNFSKKIKSGKGSARVLRGINNLQDKVNTAINTGVFAKNSNDGRGKKMGKAIMRGALKLIPNTVALGAKAPFAIVSEAGNAVINVTNAAVKLTAGSVAGGVNQVIKGYFFLRKVPTGVKKTVYRTPDALKGVLRVPGVVLERTGQVMQDNKRSQASPKNKEDEDEDEAQNETETQNDIYRNIYKEKKR